MSSESIRPQPQPHPPDLSKLPDDALFAIYGLLGDPKDMQTAELVSKMFHEIAKESPALWEEVAKRYHLSHLSEKVIQEHGIKYAVVQEVLNKDECFRQLFPEMEPSGNIFEQLSSHRSHLAADPQGAMDQFKKFWFDCNAKLDPKNMELSPLIKQAQCWEVLGPQREVFEEFAEANLPTSSYFLHVVFVDSPYLCSPEVFGKLFANINPQEREECQADIEERFDQFLDVEINSAPYFLLMAEAKTQDQQQSFVDEHIGFYENMDRQLSDSNMRLFYAGDAGIQHAKDVVAKIEILDKQGLLGVPNERALAQMIHACKYSSAFAPGLEMLVSKLDQMPSESIIKELANLGSEKIAAKLVELRAIRG